MLINAKLPISSDRLNQQDQTLRLAGMDWADYEQLLSEEYPGYRLSFFKGIITLVSPSKNHERIAEVISCLIMAYCRKFNLLYYPMRSTTLKQKPLVGKEPDVSYAFGTDKDIPDLAIEVVFFCYIVYCICLFYFVIICFWFKVFCIEFFITFRQSSKNFS